MRFEELLYGRGILWFFLVGLGIFWSSFQDVGCSGVSKMRLVDWYTVACGFKNWFHSDGVLEGLVESSVQARSRASTRVLCDGSKTVKRVLGSGTPNLNLGV